MTIEPNSHDLNKPRRKPRKELPPRLFAKQVHPVIYQAAKIRLVEICGIRDCILHGGFHGTPMCEDHAWQVWATLEAVKEYADGWQQEREKLAALEAEQDAERKRKADALAATWKGQRWIEAGWVYYLQVGRLVKIGYTRDIEQRMRQYPPNSSLLAVHPGTPKVEREMHHKFLHLLNKGREWFTIAPDLVEHVESVRMKFPKYSVSEDLESLRDAA